MLCRESKTVGDGIVLTMNHADWLEVSIATSGKVIPVPVWPKPIMKNKYILTPEASDTPKINNALIYGERPGKPFLWGIMASGNRPMSFQAIGLPDGLSIDQTTGFIRGKVVQTGNYKVLLVASNSKGTDRKEVVIKIGDKIALTPPMGWNSWNCWGLGVDDQKVRDAARMMHDKLYAYGWNYVNIDDGWEASQRSSEGKILSNEKFPDFKELTDYIHSQGLKFGIYSSPGRTTCGGHIGSYQHVSIVIRVKYTTEVRIERGCRN